MTKFAAYDNDAIHGIGETEMEAIAAAAENGAACEMTAPISDELFEDIRVNGWDAFSRAFEINTDGYAVEVK